MVPKEIRIMIQRCRLVIPKDDNDSFDEKVCTKLPRIRISQNAIVHSIFSSSNLNILIITRSLLISPPPRSGANGIGETVLGKTNTAIEESDSLRAE